MASKSTVKVSKTSAKPGETNTITITRNSSSFTHTVSYKIGATTGTIATKTSSTSLSFTVPKSVIKQSPSGNQTCTITCTTYNGTTSLGSNTCTFTVGYYSPATVSLSSTNNEIGTDVAATITKSLSDFKINLSYSFADGDVVSVLTESASTSTNISTPVATFAPLIPDSDKGILTVKVDTYYDSVKVGSTQSKTITLTLPASVVPTISNFSWSDTYKDTYGYPIAGRSQIVLSLNCGGVYGSSVKQVVYTLGNHSATDEGANFTSWSAIMPSNAITSTSWGYSVYVVDNRGRKSAVTEASSLTAFSYSYPHSPKVVCFRCDASGNPKNDGTYVATQINDYVYTPLNNLNKKEVSILRDGVEINRTTLSSYTGTTTIITSGWNADTSQQLKVLLIDDITSGYCIRTITPTFTLINFNSDGTGVAFGGLSKESNKVEFYLPIYADKGITLKEGSRISHVTDSPYSDGLYIGNADNYGWVYFSNMASQESPYNWRLTQDGYMMLKKGVCVGNFGNEKGGLVGQLANGVEAHMMYISEYDNVVINTPGAGTGTTNIYGGPSGAIGLGGPSDEVIVKHNGHNIMEELSSNSATAKSVSSGTWTNTNSKITLHPGIWVLTGRVVYAAATGKRRCARFYDTTNSSAHNRSAVMVGGSTTSQGIHVVTTEIVTITSNSTFTLQAYQDTGSSLRVTETNFYAVCVG